MRGDRTPPRAQRTNQQRRLLSGADQSRSRAPRPYGEAYAPYQPYDASTHMPAPPGVRYPGTMGRLPAAEGYTSTELAAVRHHHLGISIFHDGNPGHLWRGVFFSRLGEAVLSVGVVMWLAGLTLSPLVVAGAVVALGLPFLLAGPLAVPFENAAHPDRSLKWLGRLRMVLALGLIGMHYRTILPVVFALLFILSLCGRLSDALRAATIRTCLAPGEPEHVANDLHIASSLAAVLGPLLATLCYILLGERILLVSIGSVVFFALSANSETFLDALPERRRAFLLAVPDAKAVEAIAAEQDDDRLTPAERRERALPEWYQQGPTSASEASSDIRAGLGLAGTKAASAVALWALSALSLIGGALAILEVFYVLFYVHLPEFYWGPLVAAESAGLALGALLFGVVLRKLWRVALFGGLSGSGAALLAFAWFPRLPAPLLCALALGIANALAAAGAHHALTAGFSGVERRALAAAETWVGALCGVLGTSVVLFYNQATLLPGGKTINLPGPKPPVYPIEQLFVLLGISLLLGGIIFAVLSGTLNTQRPPRKKKGGAATSSARNRLPGRLPGVVADDEDGWGDDGEDGWDDDQDARHAASAVYDYGDTGNATGYQDTGYTGAGYYGEPDDDEPPRRSSSRNPRPRR